MSLSRTGLVVLCLEVGGVGRPEPMISLDAISRRDPTLLPDSLTSLNMTSFIKVSGPYFKSTGTLKRYCVLKVEQGTEHWVGY
jgi:hypothetical protein